MDKHQSLAGSFTLVDFKGLRWDWDRDVASGPHSLSNLLGT